MQGKPIARLWLGKVGGHGWWEVAKSSTPGRHFESSAVAVQAAAVSYTEDRDQGIELVTLVQLGRTISLEKLDETAVWIWSRLLLTTTPAPPSSPGRSAPSGRRNPHESAAGPREVDSSSFIFLLFLFQIKM